MLIVKNVTSTRNVLCASKVMKLTTMEFAKRSAILPTVNNAVMMVALSVLKDSR